MEYHIIAQNLLLEAYKLLFNNDNETPLLSRSLIGRRSLRDLAEFRQWDAMSIGRTMEAGDAMTCVYCGSVVAFLLVPSVNDNEHDGVASPLGPQGGKGGNVKWIPASN